MTTTSPRSLLRTISRCNCTVTTLPTPKINWRLLPYHYCYHPTSNNTTYQPIAPTSSVRPKPRFLHQTRTMASESSSSAERASDPPASENASASSQPPAAQPKLLPLSDHEFRQYNRLAEHMNLFHNHFRSTWNMLWGACTTGRRPAGMSLHAFVNAGLQFVQGLEMHHGIEESYVFPMLAKKMPEFRSSAGKGKGGGAAELLRQHKEIHKGLDKLQDYLRRCKSGETELEMAVLKSKMEDWGAVLWTHLDQEVETLGAQNMRRYWTLDEMRRLQM